MTIFNDIKSFNEYIGLDQPLNDDLDIGFYNPSKMRLQSDPIMVDFYRISIKRNFIDKTAPAYTPHNPNPITAVFFNSPEQANGWDIEPTYDGMYLQFSKSFLEEHRYLFKNYLNYGEHQALLLTPQEEHEFRTVFELALPYYTTTQKHLSIMIAYIQVLVSLVEAFYHRQFSTHPKQYNQILLDFQQELANYYHQENKQLPSVQYFAEKLQLTPNYLGDIIKHFTQKSAIENIHDFVIKRAKELLENRPDLNTTEIAYELGFEYPNYFSKFFKKHQQLTPTLYRKQKTPVK